MLKNLQIRNKIDIDDVLSSFMQASLAGLTFLKLLNMLQIFNCFCCIAHMLSVFYCNEIKCELKFGHIGSIIYFDAVAY